MKSIARVLVVLAGLAAIAFAVHRWIGFQSLPASSWPRRCGNCQAWALWVPLELGVAGFLASMRAAGVLRPRSGEVVPWMVLTLGILTTGAVVGAVPFLLDASILGCRLVLDLAACLPRLLRRPGLQARRTDAR